MNLKKINLLKKGERKIKLKGKKEKRNKKLKEKERKMKIWNIRQNKKKKMVQDNLGVLYEFATILDIVPNWG